MKEIIERYLKNLLSEEEKCVFLAQLFNDEVLQQEVRLAKLTIMLNTVLEAELEEMKKPGMYGSIIPTNNGLKKKKLNSGYYKWFGIAAAVSLLASPIQLTNWGSSTSPQQSVSVSKIKNRVVGDAIVNLSEAKSLAFSGNSQKGRVILDANLTGGIWRFPNTSFKLSEGEPCKPFEITYQNNSAANSANNWIFVDETDSISMTQTNVQGDFRYEVRLNSENMSGSDSNTVVKPVKGKENNSEFIHEMVSNLGQETGEQALAILPFKYSVRGQNAYSGLARQLESLTYEKFVKGKRVKLVEYQYFSELEDEKWLQSEINFIDGITINKTKARGAKYLLIGQVNDFKIVQTINNDGTKGNFSASTRLTIQVINAETSQVEISGALSAETDISDLFETTTETGAINAVVKKTEKKISQFINENWPLMGKVVQATYEGNAKLKGIIAKLGSAQGVVVGEKYLVIERQEKTLDGEKLVFDAKLGSAQLTEINGEKLSTFKILSGGDDIQKKMNSGVLLMVKSQ